MGKSWESLRKRLLFLKEVHGGIAEFCRVTGLSRSGVDKWFQDESPSAPNMDSLDAIAHALGIEPWEAVLSEEEVRSMKKRSDEQTIVRMSQGLACLREKESDRTLLTAAENLEIDRKKRRQ